MDEDLFDYGSDFDLDSIDFQADDLLDTVDLQADDLLDSNDNYEIREIGRKEIIAEMGLDRSDRSIMNSIIHSLEGCAAKWLKKHDGVSIPRLLAMNNVRFRKRTSVLLPRSVM